MYKKKAPEKNEQSIELYKEYDILNEIACKK